MAVTYGPSCLLFVCSLKGFAVLSRSLINGKKKQTSCNFENSVVQSSSAQQKRQTKTKDRKQTGICYQGKRLEKSPSNYVDETSQNTFQRTRA